MRPRSIALLDAWNSIDPMRKLAILASSVLEGKQTREAASRLLATVAVLATYLPLEERIIIAHQMRTEADALDDRKGLH